MRPKDPGASDTLMFLRHAPPPKPGCVPEVGRGMKWLVVARVEIPAGQMVTSLEFNAHGNRYLTLTLTLTLTLQRPRQQGRGRVHGWHGADAGQ